MNTLILKLTSAIVIAGEVLRAGSLVEVTRSEARDLLARGKAELHNAAPEADDVIVSSGSAETELHPALADYNADQDAARAAQGAPQAATTDAGTSAPAATPDAAQAPAKTRARAK